MKYSDKKGNIVEVSQEHVELAVKIKIELQKLSQSHNCSWNQHRKMMELEGFFDSNVNENYRQMVKKAQKKMGLLPEATKFAELISDKKLQSIESMIGDMYIEKRAMQKASQKLNTEKRKISDELIVLKDINNNIKNLDLSDVLNVDFENIVINKDKEMLIIPSDWHIGLSNEWADYGVAKKRLTKYTKKIFEYCRIYSINKVYVSHLGDLCNNIYMHRNTQASDSEFNFSEQIVESVKLLTQFLSKLSEKLDVTYIGTVEGNHGRMAQKGETLYHDSAEFIVNSMVVEMIKVLEDKNNNLHFDLSGYRPDSIIYKIGDKTIKLVHGDKESQKSSDKIQNHISRENTMIDLLCMGHYHNFNVSTENYQRKVITSGCLMGSDGYARGLGYITDASQGLVIIGKDEIIPIDIYLGDIVK